MLGLEKVIWKSWPAWMVDGAMMSLRARVVVARVRMRVEDLIVRAVTGDVLLLLLLLLTMLLSRCLCGGRKKSFARRRNGGVDEVDGWMSVRK